MVLTEERKIYMKEYRQKNKKRIKEQSKEYQKEYRQTPNGIKVYTISNWKKIGLIHDNYDKLYEHYINTTECNVCNKTFKNTKDRHLDHDHNNGQFRYVLCNSCNTKDNWKNKI